MTAQNLLTPNPFKDSVYAKKGNVVARDVYASMGFALSQWEHAEVLLSTMFALLTRPSGGTLVAQRAFGNLFSSGNRRELILGAAEAYFTLLDDKNDPKIHKASLGIHKKIRDHMGLFGDASRRRDEIAHGVVMSHGYNEQTKQFVYFLVPAFYATKKTDTLNPLKPKYRMGSTDLDRFAELFGALHLRTGEINREVRAFYDSLPETIRKRHP